MRRAALVVLGLAVAAAVGGLFTFDGERRDPERAPSAPANADVPEATSTVARRPSVVVPRGIREERGAAEDAHGDGADHGGLYRVIVEVHDEFGRPVRATIVVRAGDKDLELARGVADENGLAGLDVHEGPRAIVLRVAADGHESVEQEIIRSPGEALLDQLVVLHTNDSVLLSGRVVDEHGMPLDPERLGLIGPEHEEDPAFSTMSLGLGGTPRIIAYRTGAGRHADALVSDLESATGAFELELPAGFDGEVALVFDEQPLATEHWRAGMGPLLLTVPQDRLERAAGTLVVEVVDATGAAVTSGSIGIALDRFSLEDQPMLESIDVDIPEDGSPLVIPRVPAVQFRITARPADASFAGAATAVNVAGGATTTARLTIARGADVRVWFVPTDPNQAMSGAEDLRCIVASGLEVPAAITSAFSSEYRGAEVRGLPPGRIALQHDGNVLVLDLNEGPNADQQWRIVDPQAFTVRFVAPLERDSEELDTLRVRFELWTESGFPALRRFEEPEWVDTHDAQFVEWVPPGKYRMVLDAGVGEPMESEIVVNKSDEDVVVDLR